MKIFNYLNYEVEQKNFLYEALEINIEEKNIISFVGGGGKTTSIYTLAKELSKLGKKVVVTTTTHMHMPEDFIDFKGNVNEIIERFKSENLITVGIKDRDGKIVGGEEKIAEKLINLCDLMCPQGGKVFTIDKRLIDIMIRRGAYSNTQYHIKETYKLKEYFDNLLGYNLYDLFPEIKENL